jgi:hypothetical protein
MQPAAHAYAGYTLVYMEIYWLKPSALTIISVSGI